MRRLARWDKLPAASHPLIQAMVEKRLLVKDTRDGQVVVEVALESLLRQWRELAAWLRDEAQDLKDADALERAANDWQASGRNESWLLEGTRLDEAETLAAQHRQPKNLLAQPRHHEIAASGLMGRKRSKASTRIRRTSRDAHDSMFSASVRYRVARLTPNVSAIRCLIIRRRCCRRVAGGGLTLRLPQIPA